MKLEQKEKVKNKILEIAEYIYYFNFKYSDTAPEEWNPIILFPENSELIDPNMLCPDQSEKFTAELTNFSPWGKWNCGSNWECLKRVINIEMDSLKNIINRRLFITCEKKNENAQVIGYFNFDDKSNTRFLIYNLTEFIELSYAKDLPKLMKDTEENKPTILNSDTLLEKAYELILDFSLYPIKVVDIVSICQIYNFRPKFSGLFQKYKSI